MKIWVVRWLPRLSGYVAGTAVLAFFWGGSVIGYFEDRQQHKEYRAQACDIMVSKGFLADGDDALCRADNQTYLDGVLTATRALTPKARLKLNEEMAFLDEQASSVAIADFESVPFEEFLDLHEPMALLNDPDTSKLPLNFAVGAPWIIITGYGGLRAEDPVTNNAAQLDLDPSFRTILNGALNALCDRTSAPEMGCRGRLYIEQQTNGLSAYRVVGMQIEPLSDAQIEHANLEKLQPDFDRHSIRFQSFFFYRFIQWFGETDS